MICDRVSPLHRFFLSKEDATSALPRGTNHPSSPKLRKTDDQSMGVKFETPDLYLEAQSTRDEVPIAYATLHAMQAPPKSRGHRFPDDFPTFSTNFSRALAGKLALHSKHNS